VRQCGLCKRVSTWLQAVLSYALLHCLFVVLAVRADMIRVVQVTLVRGFVYSVKLLATIGTVVARVHGRVRIDVSGCAHVMRVKRFYATHLIRMKSYLHQEQAQCVLAPLLAAQQIDMVN